MCTTQYKEMQEVCQEQLGSTDDEVQNCRSGGAGRQMWPPVCSKEMVGQYAERNDFAGFASIIWDAVAKYKREDHGESPLGTT